jgi:Glycosyltransferase family 87
MKLKKISTGLVIFLGGMLLIHVLLLWRVRGVIAKGYPDFTTFYMAGKMVRLGLRHELYDLTTEWRVQQEFAPWVLIRQAALPYMHAPFEALLFVPLTWLPYGYAFLAWDGINLLILFLLPYLLRPHLPALEGIPPLLLFGVELAYFPVFFVLLQGQDVILLLLFYSLAFAALKRDSQGQAGFWLALGLFRFHLILPFVLVLLFVKKYRLFLTFLLTGMGLAAISAWIVGWRTFLHYPGYIWWLEQHKSSAILTPSETTNIRGVLHTLLAHWVAAPVVLAAVIVLSAITLCLAVRSWRRAEQRSISSDVSFSVTLLAAVLVGYHSFIYDLSVLLIPIAITAGLLRQESRLTRHLYASLLVPILALFCTPLYLILWFKWGHPNLMALFLILWFAALVAVKNISAKEPPAILPELLKN